MNDTLIGLAERVRQAAAAKAILRIRGGNTKVSMAGVIADAATLDMRAYSGIVDYAPSELVITARAGTPLVEIEKVLAERGQCLPFDPPRFADADGRLCGTVGGMVAAGLAGPARAAVGGVVDGGPRHVGGEHQPEPPSPEPAGLQLVAVPVVVGQHERREQEEQFPAGVEDGGDRADTHGDAPAGEGQRVHAHHEHHDDQPDQVERDDVRPGRPSGHASGS